MKKILLYVAIAFASVALFIAPSTHALTVAPTIMPEISAKPGDVITGKSVQLTNESNEQVILMVSTQDFIAKADSKDGTPEFIPSTGTDSLAKWINVEVNGKRLVLEPKQKINIPFTIQVPIGAIPGSHHAAILWEPVSGSIEPGQSVAVAGKIAAPLLLVNVEGAVKDSAAINSFSTIVENADKTENYTVTNFQKLPINFATTIVNNGTTDVKPTGILKIMNMWGGVVATLPFNAEKDGGYILPRTGGNLVNEREYINQWNDDNAFAFGKYTAKVELTYGKASLPMSKEFSFWVMPIGIVILWIVIAIVVIVILVLIIKNMMASKATTSTQPMAKKPTTKK